LHEFFKFVAEGDSVSFTSNAHYLAKDTFAIIAVSVDDEVDGTAVGSLHANFDLCLPGSKFSDTSDLPRDVGIFIRVTPGSFDSGGLFRDIKHIASIFFRCWREMHLWERAFSFQGGESLFGHKRESALKVKKSSFFAFF